MTPLGEVVHVLEELIPSHHARGGIRGNKVWASAFGEGTDLLAHVHAHASNLVLHLGTLLLIDIDASLLTLLVLDLELGGLLTPVLELSMTPLREVIHMFEELVPGHDTRSGIWGN